MNKLLLLLSVPSQCFLFRVFCFLSVFSVVQLSTCYAQSTSGKAYVGYAQYDDQIWEYDGLSLDFNAQVGCAILLTREQLEPYIGGTITGMRVGWDTSTQTGTYQGFVRSTFNGENLSVSSKTTVKYSYSDANPRWNNLTMKKYVIPEDVQQLVVGFTTTLKKDVCAIPMLYPHDTPNSCYLWVNGDNDAEGNPIWRDMNDRGILPILLTIQDTGGSFNYIPVIRSLIDDGVVWTGEPESALMRISNAGSQTIKSVEITSKQGEETYSKKVTLQKQILAGTTSSVMMMPICCFHTGALEVSITKVNDKPVSRKAAWTTSLIGVPPAVGEQYERRPLVEYYESENNYMSPRYYDDYVAPSLKNKTSYLTFVCQHLDDQFMTGDDDATALSLWLCDNDSTQVSIPAMTIDRAISTDNISYQINSSHTPMFSVLIGEYANQVLNEAMNHPTFAAVEVVGGWQQDGETIDVIVNTDVAEGIMPQGETPRLTVYLMERNVDSDSQLFWTEKEKEETMGHYTHANVIREILSDVDGDEIAEGKVTATYQTTVAPDWNTDNLYLVAFIHRSKDNGGRYMHVFNSNEGVITDGTGVWEVKNERVKSEKWAGEAYDVSGRQIVNSKSVNYKLSKGLYIINGKKVVK